MTVETDQRPRVIAMSTEALKDYGGVLKKIFPSFLKNSNGPVELVVSSQQDVIGNNGKANIIGIHYRPKRFNGWQIDVGRIAGIIRRDKELGTNRLGNYLSFHTDLLAQLKDNDEVRKYLKWFSKVASFDGIQILIENTSPRIDSQVPSWVYDWNSFKQEFGDIIEASNGRLGCCVDIAHIMISVPNIRQTIMDYKIGDEIPENLKGIMFALKYAGEIHWSRADGKGTYEQRLLFKTATEILKHIRNETIGQLCNSLCAIADNILHNHYSMTGDIEFREKLYKLLEIAGFNGVLVNEAPILLEAIRERRPPLGSLPDVQRFTSPLC